MFKVSVRLLLLLTVVGCLGSNLSSYAKELECKFFGPWYIKHEALPVDTAANGGPNSFDTPSVRIKFIRCIFGVTSTSSMIIQAGEAKGMRGYTYFAQLCSPGGDASGGYDSTKDAICINKCAYACTCPAGLFNTECDGYCKGRSDKLFFPQCDAPLTGTTLYNCANTQGSTLKVGICAYYSHLPTALNRFVDFFKHGGHANWSVTQAEKSASKLGLVACAQVPGFELTGTLLPNNEDYTSMGCFPVPLAPMPPPFGLGPMLQYSAVNVYKICSEDDLDSDGRPIAPLSGYLGSGNSPVCVLPTNGVYSTFSKPCLRVTLEQDTANPSATPPTPGKPLSYSFIDPDGGNWAERVYQFVLQDQTINTRNVSLQNDLGINLPTQTPWGYNQSSYIDLCINVDSSGTTTIDTNTLQDPLLPLGSNTRTFSPAFSCDDSDDPRSCEIFTPFTSQEVCMQEKLSGKVVNRGCVTRPLLKQPKVQFCDGSAINNKNNVCMQVSLPDFPGITAQFKGSAAKSSSGDTTGLPSTISLTIRNPFMFQAISTNDCYVNNIFGLDSTTKCTKTSDLCMQNCPQCNFPDNNMCYDPSKDTITGVTKLCLLGYTDQYTSVAPNWCTANCNQMCAQLIPDSQGQYTDIADQTIGSRLSNPLPNIPGAIPVTDFCSEPLPDTPPAKYRVKNPVEAGLCVDVYPFIFNTCLGDPICNTIRSFCSAVPESGPSNQYQNFVDCISIFKYCKEKPESPLQKVMTTLKNPDPLNSIQKIPCSYISGLITTK